MLLLRESSGGSIDEVRIGSKGSTTELMRKEQKTNKRPSPFYTLTMARAVDSVWMLGCAFFCFIGTPTLEWVQQYSLSQWVSKPIQAGFPSSALNYLIVGIFFALISCCATPLYQYFFLRCSTLLHQRMLSSVLSQPMSWFDTTPVGRILNVFAGDMMELDITLPNIFNWWSMTIPVLFTALIPAVIVVPAIIPLVLIMLIIWYI